MPSWAGRWVSRFEKTGRVGCRSRSKNANSYRMVVQAESMQSNIRYSDVLQSVMRRGIDEAR